MPIEIGSEQRVNTTVMGGQDAPEAVGLSGGGWVVLWTDYADSFRVYQQRYLANGTAVGGESRVSAGPGFNQFHYEVTALPDGGWVATWEADGQETGINPSDSGIFQRRFNANGDPVDDKDDQVNFSATNEQRKPSVAALTDNPDNPDDGGWIVVWQSLDQESIVAGDPADNTTGIYMQRYTADGTDSYLIERRVNSTIADHQTVPKVTALRDGGWVVIWESPDAQDSGIYQQRYNAAGVADPAGEVRVNQFQDNYQTYPEVAALQDGGWIVTWSSPTPGGGSGYDIYQRRFTVTGAAIGSSERVSTTMGANDSESAVIPLPDGGWIITWDSDQQGGGYDNVFQQRFSSSGKRIGGETRVNEYGTNNQQYSSPAALADGSWVVVWQSEGQDDPAQPFDYGVYQRLYKAVAPEFSLAGTVAPELAAAGTVVGTLPAGATGDNQRYTLLDDAGGRFALSGTSIIVKDGILLDREQAAAHSITVSATDVSSLTTTKAISIGVGDVAAEVTAGSARDDTIVGGGGADRLGGGAGHDTLTGGGGADTLTGDDGADTLSGGLDNDVLTGGAGHDILSGDAGTDQLLGGLDNDILTGGLQNDVLKGEAGNDRLSGGAGKDTLIGGTGRDIFVFDTKPASANIDRVTDFNVRDDTFWLDNAVFTKIGKGTPQKPVKLTADAFFKGVRADDPQDRVIYDPRSGKLYYDQDGEGGKGQVLVAQLTKNLKMTYADLFVI